MDADMKKRACFLTVSGAMTCFVECCFHRTALSSFTLGKFSFRPERSDPSPWGPGTFPSRSRASGATSARCTCRVSATVSRRCASTAPACSARTARYDLKHSQWESHSCQMRHTAWMLCRKGTQGIWVNTARGVEHTEEKVEERESETNKEKCNAMDRKVESDRGRKGEERSGEKRKGKERKGKERIRWRGWMEPMTLIWPCLISWIMSD